MTRAKGRRGRAFGYNTTGKNVVPNGGFFAYNVDRHNVSGGPGFLAYDVNPGSATVFFLVQEEDGTSLFTLEEGGGSLLTEESA